MRNLRVCKLLRHNICIFCVFLYVAFSRWRNRRALSESVAIAAITWHYLPITASCTVSFHLDHFPLVFSSLQPSTFPPSTTSSLFHSTIKTYLFLGSFPPQSTLLVCTGLHFRDFLTFFYKFLTLIGFSFSFIHLFALLFESLFLRFLFLVMFGRLRWLPVSFWVHVNIVEDTCV